MTEINYLVFKFHFHIKILDHQRVALISESSNFLLTGLLYVKIAQLLLSDYYTENEIKDKLLKEFTIEEIEYGINVLINKGFLTFSNKTLPTRQEAFWHEKGVSLEEMQLLKSLKFSVRTIGNVECKDLIESLVQLGASISEESNLEICVVDNYISSEIEVVSEENNQKNKSWLIVKPTGSVIWIGPIFRNNKHSKTCWGCLSKFLKENRRVEVDIFGSKNEALNIPSKCTLPSNQKIALNLAANEIVKFAIQGNSALENNILTIDTIKLAFKFNYFNSTPVCKKCVKKLKIQSKSSSLRLQSSLKRFISIDDERNCTPEETLEKIEYIVSPIVGIVSTIKYLNVNNTHIYYTVRNLPVPKFSRNPKIRIPDVAVGKGTTKTHAKVACLAEAIERYNCCYDNQYRILASFKNLEYQAIHPNNLLHFSEKQYSNRDYLNSIYGPFNFIPKRFDDNTKIGWTPFTSLIDRQVWYVPSSFCYLDYRFNKEVRMCPGNSNGCASGNTKEEAINYAILELIERDAFAIWWYNRISRPAIDIHSLKDNRLQKIKLSFDNLDRELFVLDITNDLKVPCFVAVSWQKKDGKRIFFGSAAHLNPKRAIFKAINELNQTMSRANIPDSMNLKNILPIERDFIAWILNETIDGHSFIKPVEIIALEETNVFQSLDFIDDINHYIKLFKRLDYDILFFDMSQAHIPFYTVKIIIPELRNFWSRLAPGRLYEVPVKQNWLMNPKSEDEMNPIPYFL